MKKILITGTAGFIGFHLTQKLTAEGYNVIGLDNLNNYYDVNLKLGRLKEQGFDIDNIDYNKPIKSSLNNSWFTKLDLIDKDNIEKLFKENNFDIVINLAAQAGVRYSLENPQAYVDTNVSGFLNILEGCRHHNVEHLIFASSSSVYGLNETVPFKESMNTDHPISMYAATKKANEMMAHSYSHLYNIACTGLRFFTVYGPWGRPDMALFLFADAIVNDKPIQIFNNGEMFRDFTYVEDIVNGITNVLETKPAPSNEFNAVNPLPHISSANYRIFNIGNSKPISLLDFIEAIEHKLNKKAKKEYLPMQPGDVHRTYAETIELHKVTGFCSQTSVEEGINKFVDWYTLYYSDVSQ